jgi:hypothetical protein
MGVSFKPSKDGISLVLTPAGLAFIKQEELKILNGPGNEYNKGNRISQMYLNYGVEEGTYEKLGWREANTVHQREPKTSSHSSIYDAGEAVFAIGFGLLMGAIWGVMELYDLAVGYIHQFLN